MEHLEEEVEEVVVFLMKLVLDNSFGTEESSSEKEVEMEIYDDRIDSGVAVVAALTAFAVTAVQEETLRCC